MGNVDSVGIEHEPAPLSQVLGNNSQTATTTPSFANYVFLWQFYEGGAGGAVVNEPVRLSGAYEFDKRCCYIVLHVYFQEQNTKKDSEPPKDKKLPPISKLVLSSKDALTPRGLAGVFGAMTKPEGHDDRRSAETGEYLHDIYLWNGKGADPLVKATALTYCFKMEKEFTHSEPLRGLISRNRKISLLSIFSNDAEAAVSANGHHHHLLNKIMALQHLRDPSKTLNLAREFERESYTVFERLREKGQLKKVKRIEVEAQELLDMSGWSPRRLIKHFDPICSRIADHLYLGSRIPSEDKQKLKENGITHILNCAGMVCKNFFPEEFEYKTLYLFDAQSQDISYLFYDVIDFIDGVKKSGGRVYVHCQQGEPLESPLD